MLYCFQLQLFWQRLSTITDVDPHKDTLRAELADARAELAQYPEPERYDSSEYSKFIKWFRLKKRVQNLEDELRDQQHGGQMQSVYMGVLIKYIMKLILFKMLLVISIYYRDSPALIFGNDISLQPLQSLLSFPTGIKNSISVPVWVMSCNAAFGVLSTFVK